MGNKSSSVKSIVSSKGDNDAEKERLKKYNAYIKSTLAPDYAAASASGSGAAAIKKYDADRDYVKKHFDPNLTADNKKYPYIKMPGDTQSIDDLGVPFDPNLTNLGDPFDPDTQKDDPDNTDTAPDVPMWVILGGVGVLALGLTIIVLKE